MSQPIHLLLVEDDDDHAFLTERTLTKVGGPLIFSRCHDYDEARSTLDEWAESKLLADGIIIDLKLPGGSGFDLVKRILNSESFAKLPLFILSTSGIAEDLALASELGIRNFFTKPLTPEKAKQLLSHLAMPATTDSL